MKLIPLCNSGCYLMIQGAQKIFNDGIRDLSFAIKLNCNSKLDQICQTTFMDSVTLHLYLGCISLELIVILKNKT